MFRHCKCRLNLLINHLKYFDLVTQKHFHLSITNRLRKPASLRKSVSPNYEEQNYEEPTSSDIFKDSNNDELGNKNFYGIEGDEGVIHVDQISQSRKSFNDLVRSTTKESFDDYRTTPDESFDGYRYLNYGAIRLDNENKPTYYSRYGKRQQKFATQDVEDNHSHQTVVENPNNGVQGTKLNQKSDFSESIENQYFGRLYDTDLNKIVSQNQKSYASLQKHQNVVENPDKFLSSQANLDQNISNKVAVKDFPNSDFLNSIEEQFFGELYDSDLNKRVSVTDRNIPFGKVSGNKESDINKGTKEYISESFPCVDSTDQNKLNNQGSFNESANFIDKSYFGQNFFNDSEIKKDQFSKNFIEKQHSNTSIKSSSESNSASVINETQLFDDETKESKRRNPYKKELYSSNMDGVSIGKKDLEVTSKTYGRTKALNIKQQFSFGKNKILSEKNFENNVSSTNENKKLTLNFPKTEFLHDADEEDAVQSTNLSEKSHEKISLAEGRHETALDFVKKLKPKTLLSDEVKRGISAKKEKKKDSKGFRILKHQVPSLQFFTRTEMMDLLIKNVLYSDDDIVVLNKPYNLVIHESGSTKDMACLSRYLDELARTLDQNNESPKLHTIHRLDKETTGCLLLARNEMSAQRLKSLFAQRKIIKAYWIVTSNVPDPLEGVINMPISEGKIKDKTRMVLHPILPKDVPYVSHSKCGKHAVTQYSVVAVSGNAALVEVKPETGIKHQIRVHFGFGLGCPILGDHKYSHLDKLAPQKLPSNLLQKLEVRQSKVRHIPLHIHAKHVLIPQYADGRNLLVSAPLPHHMVENMRFLKFKKK